MIEILQKTPIRMRWSLQHLREDLGLLARGVLDTNSFRNAYRPVYNPVQIEVHDSHGRLKYKRYTHNLRTNDGIDWQARAMGGGGVTSGGVGGAVANVPAYVQPATAGIAITAPTTTSAGQIVDTNTRAANSILINQFVGCTLVYFDTTVKIAHIVGNSVAGTNTITWYFDNWFSPDAPQTVVAAPAANKAYHVLPAGPSYYIGLSTNSGAQAAGDHTIGNIVSGSSAEIGSGGAGAPTANGLGRIWAGGGTNGTWAHLAANNQYSLKNVFTASGSFTAVQQCGMFTAYSFPNDASSDLASVGKGGGVMVFENSFSSVNMANADTLTITWTVTY
jgi:hypothetical protein